MKLLVTGGAGFIGSNFIRHILDKYPEYKIINLDKITYAGNLENLRDVENNPNYEFFKADICDRNRVASICARGIDCIVNFAAETYVDRSIVNAADFIKTNVSGVHTLLECAKEFETKLFIQIGTDEVYGSRDSGFCREEDILSPSSPYAASKAAADLLVLSYHRTYKLPAIITRSSNNFGPYQFPEKIVSLLITNLLENKKFPLYGDGLNVRDWLYVLDNVGAIDAIMHKGKTGEIYNIASGNLLTNLQVVRIILRIMDKDETFIEHVADRPGHDRRYALDCSKMRNLDWHPVYHFADAIGDTVRWYRENIGWWKPLKDGGQFCHWLKTA